MGERGEGCWFGKNEHILTIFPIFQMEYRYKQALGFTGYSDMGIPISLHNLEELQYLALSSRE